MLSYRRSTHGTRTQIKILEIIRFHLALTPHHQKGVVNGMHELISIYLPCRCTDPTLYVVVKESDTFD